MSEVDTSNGTVERLAGLLEGEQSWSGRFQIAAATLRALLAEANTQRERSKIAHNALAVEVQRSEAFRAEAARLREALAPFDVLKGHWHYQPDDMLLTVGYGFDRPLTLRLGDFRRARAALAKGDFKCTPRQFGMAMADHAEAALAKEVSDGQST